MGSDDLIPVGGRIRRANIPRDLAHPVVLHKETHVTRLVISHHHQQVCHSGRGMTLNKIRAYGYHKDHKGKGFCHFTCGIVSSVGSSMAGL